MKRGEAGDRARVRPADFAAANVTSRQSFKQVFDRAQSRLGRVDILVNCSGVSSAFPWEGIGDDGWQRVLDTNLKATHLGCQVYLQVIAVQQNLGSILNIGSVITGLAQSRAFAHSASPAAAGH